METIQAKKEQGNYSVAEENLKILMDKISSVSMRSLIILIISWQNFLLKNNK